MRHHTDFDIDANVIGSVQTRNPLVGTICQAPDGEPVPTKVSIADTRNLVCLTDGELLTLWRFLRDAPRMPSALRPFLHRLGDGINAPVRATMLALFVMLACCSPLCAAPDRAPATPQAKEAIIPDFSGPCKDGEIFQSGRHVIIITDGCMFASGKIHEDGVLWLTWITLPTGIIYLGRATTWEDGSIHEYWNQPSELKVLDDGTFTGPTNFNELRESRIDKGEFQ